MPKAARTAPRDSGSQLVAQTSGFLSTLSGLTRFPLVLREAGFPHSALSTNRPLHRLATRFVSVVGTSPRVSAAPRSAPSRELGVLSGVQTPSVSKAPGLRPDLCRAAVVLPTQVAFSVEKGPREPVLFPEQLGSENQWAPLRIKRVYSVRIFSCGAMGATAPPRQTRDGGL
ncbi:hypothetical protein TREES_T100021903 [Tupaia chinensis]|uniref:Uncharacterized protein n=1 Tax=Tupaia chinensis TaxID=246437 RepID=L9JAQ2_TUPCH|nr:hypothetical protein TREES_T100021903 [Tupaia chinensis]